MISIVRVRVIFMADAEREAIVELPIEIIMQGEEFRNQIIRERIVETLSIIGIRSNMPDPTKHLKILKTEYV